ncbi:hypothetical protein LTS18_001839, partial [Coniosporium uncinatum]
MSTFIRRSGQFARLSHQATRNPALSSSRYLRPAGFPRPLFAKQTTRYYASVQPEEPKDPKDGKTAGDKRAEDGKVAGQQKGQAAPGFEHFYNDKSPVSKPANGEQPNLSSNPTTSKLTPEEEAQLDGLLATLRQGMPAEQ